MQIIRRLFWIGFLLEIRRNALRSFPSYILWVFSEVHPVNNLGRCWIATNGGSCNDVKSRVWTTASTLLLFQWRLSSPLPKKNLAPQAAARLAGLLIWSCSGTWRRIDWQTVALFTNRHDAIFQQIRIFGFAGWILKSGRRWGKCDFPPKKCACHIPVLEQRKTCLVYLLLYKYQRQEGHFIHHKSRSVDW